MSETFQGFLAAIETRETRLSRDQARKAAAFAVILHRENERQNLTRILGAEAFVDGHLIDVVELLNADVLGETVLDLGSGSGVPGLLAAAIDQDPERRYILLDSEINKTNFLRDTATELGLSNVSVVHARVEEVINRMTVDTVIARAVGSVEKIAGWIWNCSTWNNLVLFKSRGWEDEWKEAKLSRFGKKLTATHSHDYSNVDRTRILISLERNNK